MSTDDLTTFEKELLRDLNGEDMGLCWGAAMSEALKHLHETGLLVCVTDEDGIKYNLSKEGKHAAEIFKRDKRIEELGAEIEFLNRSLLKCRGQLSRAHQDLSHCIEQRTDLSERLSYARGEY